MTGCHDWSRLIAQWSAWGTMWPVITSWLQTVQSLQGSYHLQACMLGTGQQMLKLNCAADCSKSSVWDVKLRIAGPAREPSKWLHSGEGQGSGSFLDLLLSLRCIVIEPTWRRPYSFCFLESMAEKVKVWLLWFLWAQRRGERRDTQGSNPSRYIMGVSQ